MKVVSEFHFLVSVRVCFVGLWRKTIIYFCPLCWKPFFHSPELLTLRSVVRSHSLLKIYENDPKSNETKRAGKSNAAWSFLK